MTDFYRILLADDHAMFRCGVKIILQSIDDVEVVGEAGDGLKLLELLKQTSPHMVILDISMPNLRGLEVTDEIKIIYPDIKVLILTMHKKKEFLYQAFTGGAQGYLLKEDTDSELISAVDTLRKGGTYCSPCLSSQLADLFIQKSRPTAEQPENPVEHLTTREREIIKLIAEGKSSIEISKLLFISDRTVQCHCQSFKKKLNVKKTADLVKYAIRKGYTTPL